MIISKPRHPRGLWSLRIKLSWGLLHSSTHELTIRHERMVWWNRMKPCEPIQHYARFHYSSPEPSGKWWVYYIAILYKTKTGLPVSLCHHLIQLGITRHAGTEAVLLERSPPLTGISLDLTLEHYIKTADNKQHAGGSLPHFVLGTWGYICAAGGTNWTCWESPWLREAV